MRLSVLYNVTMTALAYTGVQPGTAPVNDGAGMASDPVMPLIRLFTIILIALTVGIIVWRVIKDTMLQRQYNEVKQAKDEAEREIMAKSRFLANISREIRIPVNTIMGMNEMAMREDASEVPKPYHAAMMEYASNIHNASESLLVLINDLIDMSNIESGNARLAEQEYDPAGLLRTAVYMAKMRCERKELTFEADIDEMLPCRMYGDIGRIRQILTSLLTNAIKYTEHGGIILKVSMVEREDTECRLRISVKDTGRGIRKEDEELLFTAYERLEEQKEAQIPGTGLGLEISRRFAELMGGSLTCESVYGEGSEFIFTLKQKITDRTPMGVFKENEYSEAEETYAPGFIAPDADILIVDSNPMNLNIVKGLLKATGIFASTASSSEECLEKIRGTKFNVVLLDLMMPGMDGEEILEQIHNADPKLPVYAMTDDMSVGDELYKARGFDGSISRPVNSRKLEQIIIKHLPKEMIQKTGPDNSGAEGDMALCLR